MNWVFIIIRDSTVEQVKVFKDFWEGATFTDNFIKRVEPDPVSLPAYNRGESYTNGNLTIGLYLEGK